MKFPLWDLARKVNILSTKLPAWRLTYYTVDKDAAEIPTDTAREEDIDLGSNSDESEANGECLPSTRSSYTDPDSLFSDYLGEGTGALENDVEDDEFDTAMGGVDDDDDFVGDDPIELEQGYGQELLGRPPAKHVGDFEYDDDDTPVVVKKPRLVSQP